MGAFLRLLIAMTLLASHAYGSRYFYQRGNANGYYHRRNYYSHPQIHNQNPTYYKPKPACSAKTPCYEQLLVFNGDMIPERPNPAAFVYHFKNAGLDKYAIIEEGKRAANFFKYKYGVDVGYGLPDEAYIAPNITLANGIHFGFITQVPPTGRRILSAAAQRDAVEFPNVLVSTAGWALTFPRDFDSYGAFRGKIPAGSGAGFGSYNIEVCPYESPYNTCRSSLSRKPKGQLFIRYRSRTFSTPGIIDCKLEHEEWGQGHIIGATVKTESDGIAHERAILTFPSSYNSAH